MLANQIEPVNPPIVPDCRRTTSLGWTRPSVVIVTHNGASGVPFQFGEPDAAQLASLAPSANQQKKMIAYLRGGNYWTRAHEHADHRGHVDRPVPQAVRRARRLVQRAAGDRLPARPAVRRLRPIPATAAYKAGNAGRAVRVVAPANDGMVHVFDAGPMPSPPPMTSARWNRGLRLHSQGAVQGRCRRPAEDPSGIQALTYQDGGVPIYQHHMYVDSSPRVADVASGRNRRLAARSSWAASARAATATTRSTSPMPTPRTKPQAAARCCGNGAIPEVKYSYGRPVIVKVRDSRPGRLQPVPAPCRWVVIVTGGYDNASGLGKVFFLDAVTGTLMQHGDDHRRRAARRRAPAIPRPHRASRRSTRSSRTRATRSPSRSTAATSSATCGESTCRQRTRTRPRNGGPVRAS